MPFRAGALVIPSRQLVQLFKDVLAYAVILCWAMLFRDSARYSFRLSSHPSGGAFGSGLPWMRSWRILSTRRGFLGGNASGFVPRRCGFSSPSAVTYYCTQFLLFYSPSTISWPSFSSAPCLFHTSSSLSTGTPSRSRPRSKLPSERP